MCVCVLVVIHCYRGCILVNALSVYYLGNCAILEIFFLLFALCSYTRLGNKWVTAEILERKEKWTKRSRRAIKCLKKLSAADLPFDQCLPASRCLSGRARVCVCVCVCVLPCADEYILPSCSTLKTNNHPSRERNQHTRELISSRNTWNKYNKDLSRLQ